MAAVRPQCSAVLFCRRHTEVPPPYGDCATMEPLPNPCSATVRPRCRLRMAACSGRTYVLPLHGRGARRRMAAVPPPDHGGAAARPGCRRHTLVPRPYGRGTAAIPRFRRHTAAIRPPCRRLKPTQGHLTTLLLLAPLLRTYYHHHHHRHHITNDHHHLHDVPQARYTHALLYTAHLAALRTHAHTFTYSE